MRKVLLPFIALITLLVFWLIITDVSRVGKIKVSVTVAPSGSTVTVDGKTLHGSTTYVHKGKHRFVASFRNFTPDTQDPDVQKPTSVVLYPTPGSEAALAFLRDNPQTQQEREKLAGEAATRDAQTVANAYPFLNQLPVIVRGFEIYQSAPVRSQNKQGKIALDIVTDGPLGRQRSIEFIRTKLNVDPSTIEINFDGMNNVFYSQRGD